MLIIIAMLPRARDIYAIIIIAFITPLRHAIR